MESMATNNEFNSPGSTTNPPATSAVRGASTLCLLCGIWLFFSPWVYGAGSVNGTGWNGWIVGLAIVILSLVRLARPAYSTLLSWCNMVLGIWIFFSPWIYGYTGNEGRFINSLCIGVIVFIASIASATMSRRINVTAAGGQHIGGQHI